MSEYKKDNLYFVKLYDSFMNSDEIRWIESQEHGAEIVLIFIRLMMAAKNRNGKLARIVGKMEDPYDIKEIASITFQTKERVIEGLEILEKAELVVKQDNCYTIPKALEYTNQTTVGAVKKQEERKRKADKMADNCLTDIEEEKRIKKKEKEEEIYIEETDDFPYDEVIEYFNNKIGTNYKTNSNEVIGLIKQHVKNGYTKENFIDVINKKYNEWNETEYSKYLRPKTLFGDKFESYVNQVEPKKTRYDELDLDSYYANSH